MAICPFAKWEPVSGHSDGPMRSYTGIVLHCNDAHSYDLHDFVQNSDDVSCHFQIGADGFLWQYLDTSEQSWCQGHGNADYLSVETEGLAGELMTPAQVATLARLMAWVHATHNIPLTLADAPGQRGLGWHGMGAAAGDPGWGHAACPGVRKDQRAQVLAAAGGKDVLDSTATQIGDIDVLSDDDKTVIKAISVAADQAFDATKEFHDRVLIALQDSNIGPKIDALAKQITALTDAVSKLQSGPANVVPAQPLPVSGTLTFGSAK